MSVIGHSNTTLLHGGRRTAYRFEYKRAPSSWDGDPAPSLALPMEPAAPFRPVDDPNGGFIPADPDRSLGELRPVLVPDIGWVVGI